VSDPQSRKQYKLRCRRFVEENYSWQRNVDQLETLIEDHRLKA
jgi:glycosyltransferase involved in cell wall biosynthesis